MSTTTIILGIATLASGVMPYIPAAFQWLKKSNSMEELMVKEYRAVYTIKERAKRRSCKELEDAIEQVEKCFMGGDDPL